ncbi:MULTISPECIES: heme-binding domain-containing protein [Pedobacter]|uniref:heme-binding domain-containing protein n=1 Tax=Pedobacter TaxID=84567 RepID=UPI00292F10BD|nr:MULTISPECIES: heme-binding domain-containing protein [Pedobacter]
MKNSSKVFIGIAALIIGLQFIQPSRNDQGDPLHGDFQREFNVPQQTGQILSRSCFDCHSNRTSYPWYTMLQPIGWWMGSHVNKGKVELNFDEFSTYSLRRKQSKLKSIANRIGDQSMPLPSYTLVHRSAKLSDREQKILTDWVDGTLDSLNQNKR